MDPKLVDDACREFKSLAVKYAGQYHSICLEAQVFELTSPMFKGTVDQLVPSVVIDWK